MKELTVNQMTIRRQLGEQFQIDPERILFLNESKPEEAWLNAEALTTIARRSGNFQAISEGFDQFIEPLNQVVHVATVVDKIGHTFTRAGIATIGESSEVDEHELAAGRAVRATLTAAGFNPLRPGAAVTLELNLPQDAAADAAQVRTVDIRRIHALAEEKGLIQHLPSGTKDVSAYRTMLKEKFSVSTVVNLGPTERASVIHYLQQLPNSDQLAEEEFAAEEELVLTH